MQGIIKFFDQHRYFGIIQVTDEHNRWPVAEFFLHGSEVAELLADGEVLNAGTPVNFWLDDDMRGERLMCVEIEIDVGPMATANPAPNPTFNPSPNATGTAPDHIPFDDPQFRRTDLDRVYESEFKRTPRRGGHWHARR